MQYVVVPEGLSIDSTNKPIPSFVYRQVIEYLVPILDKNDEIYFAPANSFGLGISEQIAGKKYFKKIYNKKNNIKVFTQELALKEYVDTYGNAILLKKQFPQLALEQIDLVSTYIHSRRAYHCFYSAGFKINNLHSVKYKIIDEKIVSRLWYYQYPKIHKIYEMLALLRDLLTKRFRLNSV